MNAISIDFQVVSANQNNISEVSRLMEQQAQHHENVYKGTTSSLSASLDGKHPLMHAFLVYKPDSPDSAVCCTTYKMIWTPEGRASYLEDICTDKTFRGGGIGKFAIEEMRRKTLAEGGNAITGAVAKNNTRTMEFWIKNGYSPLPKQAYDLTNLFNDDAAVTENHSCTARRVTDVDSVLPAFLQPAVTDPTVGIYVIEDRINTPMAIAIANAKFTPTSCDRAVAVEPIMFLKETAEDEKKQVMKAALSASIAFAKAHSHTDKFYALAQRDCSTGNEFLNSIGNGPRQDSDNPESLLVCMGLRVA